MAAQVLAKSQPLYLHNEPPKVTVQLSESDSVMFAGFPDLLTTAHISLIISQSEKTVRKMLSDGVLPCVRIGERLYCPKSKLIEYVVAQVGGIDE